MPTLFDAGPHPFVIAEIAQTHDGSLGTAHAYIDAVAKAGAHAIKFQTHIAAAESSPDEPWRVKFSRQDASRYDYWKRMEFTEEQWAGLFEHAHDRDIEFLSSPFSNEAVALLERIGVRGWKVGAGETLNAPMLEKIALTRKPVALSSGLSCWSDLDLAVGIVRSAGCPLAVLQCTTAYPCPPEKLGLNVMAEIRRRYECLTGLSDHSGTIYSGLAAAALGADVIEVHVAFSRDCFGPDVPASITIAELAQLVEGAAFVRRALESPIDKAKMTDELSEMRTIFGKSIVAARDLPAGCSLQEADLSVRKPGTGIPASKLKELIERRLKRAVRQSAMLMEEDFE